MRKPIQVPQAKRNKRTRNVASLLFLLLSFIFVVTAHAYDQAGTAYAPLFAQATPSNEGQGTATPPVQGQPSSDAAAPLPDSAAARSVREALLKDTFSYTPKSLVDPFIAFIAPADTAPPVVSNEDEDLGPPVEPQRPLTPLQKMKISEIEKGLKAITWGDLGRKAIIEDAAGKGYIVGVGTPVGEKNGVVTEIFNDHLVIQQEYWDKKAKRMIPQNFVVKLVKVKPK